MCKLGSRADKQSDRGKAVKGKEKGPNIRAARRTGWEREEWGRPSELDAVLLCGCDISCLSYQYKIRYKIPSFLQRRDIYTPTLSAWKSHHSISTWALSMASLFNVNLFGGSLTVILISMFLCEILLNIFSHVYWPFGSPLWSTCSSLLSNFLLGCLFLIDL